MDQALDALHIVTSERDRLRKDMEIMLDSHGNETLSKMAAIARAELAERERDDASKLVEFSLTLLNHAESMIDRWGKLNPGDWQAWKMNLGGLKPMLVTP